jgi:hypothetical protein
VPTIYGSHAFGDYARERISHADVQLAVHDLPGLGLCRCGRLHPCDQRRYWIGIRSHYVEFVGEPSTWGELVRPYLATRRGHPEEARPRRQAVPSRAPALPSHPSMFSLRRESSWQ